MSQAPLRVTVLGTPVPKGSTKAFWRPGMKHAVVTHDNAKTKPWQEAVVSAAADALGLIPLDQHAAEAGEPVVLELLFLMPRPVSAPKRVTRPTKKPDLDKLVRCVKDGLTRAGVYRDDAQVIATLARKEFAGGAFDPDGPHGIPRAEILVHFDAGLASTLRAPRPGDLFATAERA